MTDSPPRPGSASPRRPPATSTSAAPGPRSSTGSSPASIGGTFVLRIEDTDERAQPPGMDRRDPLGARLAGHGARRGPVPPVGAGGRARRRDRGAVGQRARSTPARARARRSTSGRGNGRRPATPRRATTGSAATSGCPGGRGGRCASGRPTRAPCGCTTSSAATWSSPSAHSRTSSCVKGDGTPLFVLANAVDDRTMAITHVIRGEDLLPTTPRQIMLWAALNAAEGRDLACPPSPTCRCWSTSGARSSPSGAIRSPWRCTGSRATCPRPCATTWRCWVGAPATRRSCRSRRSSSASGWRTCSARRPSSTPRSSRTSNGVYIRALSVDGFVAAARPWVGPGRGSGRRAPGAIPTPAPGRRAPAVAARALRRRASSPRWPRWSRSGSRCSARCPSWSTSSSWRTRRTTPKAGRRPSPATSWHRGS